MNLIYQGFTSSSRLHTPNANIIATLITNPSARAIVGAGGAHTRTHTCMCTQQTHTQAHTETPLHVHRDAHTNMHTRMHTDTHRYTKALTALLWQQMKGRQDRPAKNCPVPHDGSSCQPGSLTAETISEQLARGQVPRQGQALPAHMPQTGRLPVPRPEMSA